MTQALDVSGDMAAPRRAGRGPARRFATSDYARWGQALTGARWTATQTG